jgi:hypothetical protein
MLFRDLVRSIARAIEENDIFTDQTEALKAIELGNREFAIHETVNIRILPDNDTAVALNGDAVIGIRTDVDLPCKIRIATQVVGYTTRKFGISIVPNVILPMCTLGNVTVSFDNPHKVQINGKLLYVILSVPWRTRIQTSTLYNYALSQCVHGGQFRRIKKIPDEVPEEPMPSPCDIYQTIIKRYLEPSDLEQYDSALANPTLPDGEKVREVCDKLLYKAVNEYFKAASSNIIFF